jgi:hypothetical protein
LKNGYIYIFGDSYKDTGTEKMRCWKVLESYRVSRAIQSINVVNFYGAFDVLKNKGLNRIILVVLFLF